MIKLSKKEIGKELNHELNKVYDVSRIAKWAEGTGSGLPLPISLKQKQGH